MLYTSSTDDVWTKYSDAEIHWSYPTLDTMLHSLACNAKYIKRERERASLLLLACIRSERIGIGKEQSVLLLVIVTTVTWYQNTGRKVTYIPAKLVLFLTDCMYSFLFLCRVPGD